MLSFSDDTGAGLPAEDMAGVPVGAVFAGAGFDVAAGTLEGDTGAAGEALGADGLVSALFDETGADALAAAAGAAGALTDAGETGAAGEALDAGGLVSTLFTGAGAAVLVAAPAAAAAGVLAGAEDAGAEGDAAATF